MLAMQIPIRVRACANYDRGHSKRGDGSFPVHLNLSAVNDVLLNLDWICGSANGSPKIR